MDPNDLNQPDDRELIDRINMECARGNFWGGAFEILYHRYRDWVVQLAGRLLREQPHSRDVALDITQETFLWLANQFPGFELRAKMKTVLYPVVRNLAYDHLRKLRTRERYRESMVGRASPSAAADLRYVAKDKSSQSRQLPEPLHKLLMTLSDTHTEVLYLRFVDDLTLEEIAQAIEIPLGTAKTRLFHALKALRDNPATADLYFD